MDDDSGGSGSGSPEGSPPSSPPTERQLPPPAAATPTKAAASSSKPQSQSQADVFSVGELVDLEWKLGVGVESSNCQRLSYPFVSLRMRTIDSNGKASTHTVELTISEFQELARNFKDIANLLDSL